MSNEMREWERLGRLLVARRIELGFPVRATFVKERKLKHGRTVSDIENAKRTNYEPSTLALMEQIYEWAPGSIDEVLRGGDPTPVEVRRATGRLSFKLGTDATVSAPPAPTRGVARPPVVTGERNPQTVEEAQATLVAVSRSVQDAWAEMIYAQEQMADAARRSEAAARRHDHLREEEARLVEVLHRLHQEAAGEGDGHVVTDVVAETSPEATDERQSDVDSPSRGRP